jgi:hypothetical protein
MTSGPAGEPTAPATCPACGASLLAVDDRDAQEPVTAVYREDDDSATQPVPIDQLPTRPPAQPAQPAQPAPAANVAAEADDGATRDLPASALPTPPGAGLARMGRVIGAVALVVVLLAVVVVAALAINGAPPFGQQAATATATTAATAQPTATPATIPYTRAGLYQMSYPTGWLAPERNNPPMRYSVTVVNPRGGASLTVTVQQVSELIDPATTDIAGQTWTQEAADVTILTSAGVQYAHAVATTINHGGYLYTIVRLVPVIAEGDAASAFATADQASFQPILASFTFLG